MFSVYLSLEDTLSKVVYFSHLVSAIHLIGQEYLVILIFHLMDENKMIHILAKKVFLSLRDQIFDSTRVNIAKLVNSFVYLVHLFLSQPEWESNRERVDHLFIFHVTKQFCKLFSSKVVMHFP